MTGAVKHKYQDHFQYDQRVNVVHGHTGASRSLKSDHWEFEKWKNEALIFRRSRVVTESLNAAYNQLLPLRLPLIHLLFQVVRQDYWKYMSE